MEQWELEARFEIAEALARYVRAADTGRSEELAGLFTSDGVLTTDADEVRGRVEIAAYLEATKADLAGSGDASGRIRHHLAVPNVELVTPTEARVTTYFLAVLTATGPDHWGVYRDRLVRDGDRWWFASRAATVEGATSGGWAVERRAGSRAEGPDQPGR